MYKVDPRSQDRRVNLYAVASHRRRPDQRRRIREDEGRLARPSRARSSRSGQSYKPNKADWLDGQWSGLRSADNQDEQRRGKTSRADEAVEGNRQASSSTIPEGFRAHRTIQRFMDNRYADGRDG
jgi:2-oxoglutarate dehydrogenase complex dehydrogenase (E1) component-like enzyme